MKKTILVSAPIVRFRCIVDVQTSSANKVENVSPYLKKEEHLSQPKNERFH